jgi:AcrR family transcriptional regulator
MARIVKENEYNAKRSEILDFALRLIYSKGYEKMTIQDILDGLHISRGALYHYFDSKQALLEALVDRMGSAAVETFLPVLQDPHLSAIQKFHHYFETSAAWKNAGKALIISTLHVWYSDENAILRQKMSSQSIKGTARILEPMIRQGIEEKVFTTPYPEQVAEIIAGVALTLADSIIGLVISPQPDPSAYQKTETILNAYFDTIERILGAPAGSLKAFDAQVFKEWFVVSQPEVESK